MQLCLHQILNCPYQGATLKIYLEAKEILRCNFENRPSLPELALQVGFLMANLLLYVYDFDVAYDFLFDSEDKYFLSQLKQDGKIIPTP